MFIGKTLSVFMVLNLHVCYLKSLINIHKGSDVNKKNTVFLELLNITIILFLFFKLSSTIALGRTNISKNNL